jgi:FkbM family methyltransferase
VKEDLVFDLGLHKGEDTAFYLKKGYRVVAVEADPDLAAACRHRFRPEIDRGALHIIEGAIVAVNDRRDGYVKFYKNPQESLWGSTDAAWRDRNARLGAPSTEIEVPRLDFGAILRRHGMPYYMKIDLEGADRLALGYLQDFDTRPRYLSLEDEKVDFSRLLADLDLLWRLGYRKFRAVQQSDIPTRHYDGHDRLGRPISHQFERGASGPFGADLAGLDDRWMTRDELVVEYKWIFEMYRTFGDDSPCAQDRSLSELRLELERRLQRPLPGWYDTHATF